MSCVIYYVTTLYTIMLFLRQNDVFHVEMAMKATLLCVLLCLLWSLVEVQSQTEYPYISFRGRNLSNHSYVDFRLVREQRTGPNSNTVQCHTDLSTCCRKNESIGVVGRGDWFAPGSDTRLPFGGELPVEGGIYEDRQSQVVHLRHQSFTYGPSGIYRCVIPTNAVHDDRNGSVGEIVYVGIYRGSRGTWKNMYSRYTPAV